MEPRDITSDAAIESALRVSATSALADDGFTARVMEQLPAPKRRWQFSWDVETLSTLITVAGVLVFCLFGPAIMRQVTPTLEVTTAWLSGLWRDLGFAVAIVTCIYVFWDDLENERAATDVAAPIRKA